MKRNIVYAVAIFTTLFIATACKKDKNTNLAYTVANLTGTYGLTALVWSDGSRTENIYDSLDACERDNLIQLNADMTINYIDAGTVCAPPEDGIGAWSLSGDSLYLDTDAAKIKSFDGKTLILTGVPLNNPGVIGTTTLTKK